MSFSFQYTECPTAGRARLGLLETPHGTVQTPAFIFCATRATLKGITPAMMTEAGTQMALSNTYHLMLQPGSERIQKLGGLHRFMGFSGPMLTDSGGFQVFSLGHGSVSDEIKGRRMQGARPSSVLKIDEDGVLFRSYRDGSKQYLSPERSIEVQHQLGADLIVVFDECTPFHVAKEYTEASMHRSHRWALRSLETFQRLDAQKHQRLYGIIQGGVYEDLRHISCDFVNEHPFFGHAIGGSLGLASEQMYEVVGLCTERLRRDRPIHLLGIGGIRDIFEGVRHGVDTFDCVHPTRLGRHGGALVKRIHNPHPKREHIQLTHARYRDDPSPIEDDCDCYTCRHFSKAYLHHLFYSNETLALVLTSLHNVRFMNALFEQIRLGLRDHQLDSVQSLWSGDRF